MIAACDKSGIQDGIRPRLRALHDRDLLFPLKDILPFFIPLRFFQAHHHTWLFQSVSGTHFTIAVGRFQCPLRLKEEHSRAALHMARDVSGPVASGRYTFVVPEAPPILVEDPDRTYDLLRLLVGITDKQIGAGSLIRFKKSAHDPPPVSIMVYSPSGRGAPPSSAS